MILEQMAHDIGIPAAFIQALAKSASYEYKTYTILKRAGGHRTIHHPSRRLKALQRWLLTNVLEQLPLHGAAMAYRHGVSILDNAKRHAASRYLLRMDLKNFFPSINVADIGRYIAERSHLFKTWSTQDIDLFCNLVCRNGALTIGAPTSPALSNAICFDMDVALDTLSSHAGVTYSRYADDLFFSTIAKDVLGDFQDHVASAVTSLKYPANLNINAAKTRHSSKRGARRVTGIVLGSDGKPYLGRTLKRRIRALIFKFDTLDDAAKSTLAGLIAYAIGLDPAFLNRLVLKYGLPRVREARAQAGVGS